MIKELKITGRTQFKHYKGLIYLSILLVVACWYSFNQFEAVPHYILLLIFGIAFLLQLLFLIPMHLNYYYLNKYDNLTFDNYEGKVLFKSKNKQITFFLNDIRLIEKHLSYAKKKKTASFSWFDDYQHEVIFLYNGSKIIITSLMDFGLSSIQVDPDKITYKISFFRWAKGPSLQLHENNDNSIRS